MADETPTPAARLETDGEIAKRAMRTAADIEVVYPQHSPIADLLRDLSNRLAAAPAPVETREPTTKQVLEDVDRHLNIIEECTDATGEVFCSACVHSLAAARDAITDRLAALRAEAPTAEDFERMKQVLIEVRAKEASLEREVAALRAESENKCPACNDTMSRIEEAQRYGQTYCFPEAWGRNVWHAILDDALRLRAEAPPKMRCTFCGGDHQASDHIATATPEAPRADNRPTDRCYGDCFGICPSERGLPCPKAPRKVAMSPLHAAPYGTAPRAPRGARTLPIQPKDD